MTLPTCPVTLQMYRVVLQTLHTCGKGRFKRGWIRFQRGWARFRRVGDAINATGNIVGNAESTVEVSSDDDYSVISISDTEVMADDSLYRDNNRYLSKLLLLLCVKCLHIHEKLLFMNRWTLVLI